MMAITIEKDSVDKYNVTVDGARFIVTLYDDYHKEIAPTTTKEELVVASFKFLLDREPKESILKTFNLKVIETYFPDFREKIEEYLDSVFL